MIENMRKYTGLMAIVFVLLGAGFLFTMNDIGGSRGGGGSGPTMLEVYGESFDQSSYQKMGISTLQLASEAGLHSYINFLMAPDAAAIQQSVQLGAYGMNYFSIAQRDLGDQDINRFIANRVILQKAMTDMGLYASDEEVTETLKSAPNFTNRSGKFDQAAYSLFIEKRLGRLGMTEQDLRDVVRESLCLNKLVSVVGGGLTPSRTTTKDIVEAQSQTVTLAKIVFNRDDFVEQEKPSEEEIKTYWEAHQDAYKTDEKRRISYILLNLPAEEEESTPEPEEKKDEATMTDAEKEADKAKKEAEAKEKAEKAEKRRIAAKTLTKQITETYQAILDSESAKLPLDIAAIAKDQGHNLVQSELFTRASLPEAIKDLNLRGSSNRNRPLAEDIFGIANSDNAYDRVSDPLPVGENGWIIFTLEEIVEPVLLDYNAARNKARANLIGENATRKVKQAAKDQRLAILDAMKAGKSFDEAAKELKLTPVQVGPYSANGVQPKDEPSARQMHSLASGINPGEVSEPMDENDRSLFFYVDKRELEDNEQNKLQVDRAVDSGKIDLMIRTYLSWLKQQYVAADVKGYTVQ